MYGIALIYLNIEPSEESTQVTVKSCSIRERYSCLSQKSPYSCSLFYDWSEKCIVSRSTTAHLLQSQHAGENADKRLEIEKAGLLATVKNRQSGHHFDCARF